MLFYLNLTRSLQGGCRIREDPFSHKGQNIHLTLIRDIKESYWVCPLIIQTQLWRQVTLHPAAAKASAKPELCSLSLLSAFSWAFSLGSLQAALNRQAFPWLQLFQTSHLSTTSLKGKTERAPEFALAHWSPGSPMSVSKQITGVGDRRRGHEIR